MEIRRGNRTASTAKPNAATSLEAMASQSADATAQANVFTGKLYYLPATYSNGKKLIERAKLTEGISYTKTADAINEDSPTITNYMKGTLTPQRQKRVTSALVPYFSAPDRNQLVDDLYIETATRNTHDNKLTTSLAETRRFADVIGTFFNVIEDNAKLLKGDTHSFYYCYKRSQRFRQNDDDPHSNRKIIKSIVSLRLDDSSNIFIFEDRQFNKPDPTISEKEVTHGVAFAQANDIFLFGREIDEYQPRLFWLHPGTFGATLDGGNEVEHIQFFTGYCFEGYAKYESPSHHRTGSFFSPIGLRRISIEDVKSRISTLDPASYASDNLKELTEYTDVWYRFAWRVLTDDAKILSDIDLPIDHPISKHLESIPWVDSSERAGGAKK